MNPVNAHGFTLIELMVTITLFAILSLLAMPMYTSFIANSQIRTASESMLAGLRLAQTEALKRNGTVEFVLDTSTGWQVNDLTDPDKVSLISQARWTEGGSKADVVPTTDGRRVAFNGLGRILVKSPTDDTAPISAVNVGTKMTALSNPRNLRLLVDTAGIRLCDPNLPGTDPAGCP